MKKEVVIQLHSQFEGIVHIVSDSEVEFWYARELQEALGYDRWENFKKVIEKAITSCETLGVNVLDHIFVTSRKWSKSDSVRSGPLRILC